MGELIRERSAEVDPKTCAKREQTAIMSSKSAQSRTEESLPESPAVALLLRVYVWEQPRLSSQAMSQRKPRANRTDAPEQAREKHEKSDRKCTNKCCEWRATARDVPEEARAGARDRVAIERLAIRTCATISASSMTCCRSSSARIISPQLPAVANTRTTLAK